MIARRSLARHAGAIYRKADILGSDEPCSILP
jgi:hypothetical protein